MSNETARTDQVIELEYIDADGDRVMLRVGPRTALAIVQALTARLEDWAAEPGDDDAE